MGGILRDEETLIFHYLTMTRSDAYTTVLAIVALDCSSFNVTILNCSQSNTKSALFYLIIYLD